jgi:hypothetical protein
MTSVACQGDPVRGALLLQRLKPLLNFQRSFKEQHGRSAADSEVPQELKALLYLYREHKADLFRGTCSATCMHA